MWSWIYWWRTINVDCLSLHVHFWVNKPINFKDCLAVGLVCYRFSAFWLRSKCSICSYQLNIWYAPYMGASILNWFLNLGEVSGACSAFATGWPGIAVPPGSAHSPLGDNEIQWQYNKHISKTAVDVTAFVGEEGIGKLLNVDCIENNQPDQVLINRKVGKPIANGVKIQNSVTIDFVNKELALPKSETRGPYSSCAAESPTCLYLTGRPNYVPLS